MAKRWNPLTPMPSGPIMAKEFLDWASADVALFQSEHPVAPQGNLRTMSKRDRERLVEIYERTRARAKKKAPPERG